MDHIARFDPKDRSDLFRAAAEERGVTSGIIEKDFWVCWVLRRIYTLSGLPVQIFFKGGTSLSKVFGVIERMSEDIDLVIDRRGLGFTGDKDPAAPGLSNKARQRLVGEVKSSAREFVRGELEARQAQQEERNDCMVEPSVLYDASDGIGVIRFNRQSVRNAIDGDTIVRLRAILDHVDADANVRCLIITSAKAGMFCAREPSEDIQRHGEND